MATPRPDPYAHLGDRLGALFPGRSDPGNHALKEDGPSQALLATAGNQVYTWDAANSTLRMTRLERRAGSDVVLLKPTYGSGGRRAGGDDGSCRHSVRQLVVNESGTFMALVGSTNISVVRLPENRGETDPITDAVPCSARRIGNVYNANGIKQVCWHPLSRDCLVVLNGDGKLRFYDAYKHRKGEEFPSAIDAPDLELEVGPDGTRASGIGLGADEAVAFDFGSSNGWDMFTIYVLRGSGDIFFFCPVVPNGCAVSSALLPDEMRRGDPSSSQLKVWLDEIRPKALRDSAVGQSSVGPRVWLLNHVPDHEEPKKMTGCPAEQGPLAKFKDDDNHDLDLDEGTGILVLACEPTAVVTTDTSGKLVVAILTAPVQPAWKYGPKVDAPEICTLEILDLQLNPQSSTTLKNEENIQLLRDPKYLERFYAYHAEGIHSVESVYLADLNAEFEESVPTFKSKLERPLDTTSNGKDSNPVQGMLILSAPLVGYHMVWLTANGEVCVEAQSELQPNNQLEQTLGQLEQSFRQMEDDTLNTSLAKMKASGVAGREWFEGSRQLQANTTGLTHRNTSDAPSNIMQLSQNVNADLEAMRNYQLKPIMKQRQALLQRTVQLQQAEDIQLAKLAELQHEIETREQENVRLQAETKVYQDNMTTIIGYMEMIVGVYNSTMKIKSDAEAEYRRSVKVLGVQAEQLTRNTRKLDTKYRRADEEEMLKPAGAAAAVAAAVRMSASEQASWMNMAKTETKALSTNIDKLLESQSHILGDDHPHTHTAAETEALLGRHRVVLNSTAL